MEVIIRVHLGALPSRAVSSSVPWSVLGQVLPLSAFGSFLLHPYQHRLAHGVLEEIHDFIQAAVKSRCPRSRSVSLRSSVLIYCLLIQSLSFRKQSYCQVFESYSFYLCPNLSPELQTCISINLTSACRCVLGTLGENKLLILFAQPAFFFLIFVKVLYSSPNSLSQSFDSFFSCYLSIIHQQDLLTLQTNPLPSHLRHNILAQATAVSFLDYSHLLTCSLLLLLLPPLHSVLYTALHSSLLFSSNRIMRVICLKPWQ